MTNPLLDAALAYAALGFYVFPCTPGEKTPLGAFVPQGKDNATIDTAQITAWWSAAPNANIGIAAAPSGLVILDVDVADGKPGLASLAAFEAEYGALPPTWSHKTGRGGLHLPFRRPAGVEAHTRLKFREGLDLIGKGYIIAAPSVLKEGGAYQWLDTSKPLAELPASLTAVLTRGESSGVASAPDQRGPVADADKAVAAALFAANWPKTGRHQAQLALAGALAQEGWSAEEIAEFCAGVARLEAGRPAGYDGEYAAKRLPAARSSVEKVAAGEQVAGWGVLESIVTKPVIDQVRSRLHTAAAQFADALKAHAAPTITGGETPRKVRRADEIALIEFPAVKAHPTSNEQLNDLLGGGVLTQQILTLAGPPGAAKTAFCLDLALALERRVPVLYVSTELHHNEITARLVGNVLAQPFRDIVKGSLSRQAQHEALRDRRIYQIDKMELPRNPALEEGVLPFLAERVDAIAQEEGESPVLIGDYWQVMARGSEDGMRARMGILSMGMLNIAQKFDCAVIGVVSVSRAFYAANKAKLREAGDPSEYLSAAKESGDVEYDSATVLYLDIERLPDGTTHPCAIAVAKCRHGEIGFVGGRVEMASGRWRGDPSAVSEVLGADPSKRTAGAGAELRAARVEAEAKQQDAAVLAKVTERAYERHELEQVCGLAKKNAEAAIRRLLSNGTLTTRPDVQINRLGRSHRVDVIDLPGRAPVPVAPPPPAAPHPALAAFLGGMRQP